MPLEDSNDFILIPQQLNSCIVISEMLAEKGRCCLLSSLRTDEYGLYPLCTAGILSHADANGDVEHMYQSGSYLASRSLESGGSLTLRSQRRNLTGGVYPPSDV